MHAYVLREIFEYMLYPMKYALVFFYFFIFFLLLVVGINNSKWIDTVYLLISQKSQNAPVRHSTIHHYITEMCKFLFYIGALWDTGKLHWVICEIGLSSYFK